MPEKELVYITSREQVSSDEKDGGVYINAFDEQDHKEPMGPALIIENMEDTSDPLIPHIWKHQADNNKFKGYQTATSGKQSSGGALCCTIV